MRNTFTMDSEFGARLSPLGDLDFFGAPVQGWHVFFHAQGGFRHVDRKSIQQVIALAAELLMLSHIQVQV